MPDVTMDAYERRAIEGGAVDVAGVDEAGRGPLAGPVVAAAVVFPGLPPLGLGIRDSKKLTPERRASLVFEIHRNASAVSLGVVWPAEIDRINIHRSSLLAMRRAVSTLPLTPGMLLIDGIFTIDSLLPQRPVKSGDSLSVSIAAASIIAKTARDRMMEAYHRIWPVYGFSANKGYPTGAHRRVLADVGPCPIHRRSFSGVLHSEDAGCG